MRERKEKICVGTRLREGGEKREKERVRMMMPVVPKKILVLLFLAGCERRETAREGEREIEREFCDAAENNFSQLGCI